MLGPFFFRVTLCVVNCGFLGKSVIRSTQVAEQVLGAVAAVRLERHDEATEKQNAF